MADTKKVKNKCCHKVEKKGKQCSNCPLTGQDDGKKTKKEKKSKKKS